VAPKGSKPALKNQAQATRVEVWACVDLTTINYLGKHVEANRDFLRDHLGALVTEQIVMNDGSVSGSWTTFTNKGYDAVYTVDRTGSTGRLHPRPRKGRVLAGQHACEGSVGVACVVA